MINSRSPRTTCTDLPKTTCASTVPTQDTPVKAGGGQNTDKETEMETNHTDENEEDTQEAEDTMIEEMVGMHSVNANNMCSRWVTRTDDITLIKDNMYEYEEDEADVDAGEEE